jgi:PleD family two-component response regulator
LDDSLPDIGAVDVCRALRDDPLFNHATPVIIMAPAQYASRIRAAAYAAGAWDYCTLPVDVETLLARLATFIRARQEVDTIRSKALFDGLTGLYTEYGLEQWAEQLGARALRKREPLACVVVAPDLPVVEGTALTPEQTSEALSIITDVCRAQARRSDILGYLGQSRVAILAPDTDVAGVQRLIDRLQQSLHLGATKGQTRQRPASLRAGYCAVSNLAASNLSPSELVRRAGTALAYAPRGGFDSAAVNFDEMLTS